MVKCYTVDLKRSCFDGINIRRFHISFWRFIYDMEKKLLVGNEAGCQNFIGTTEIILSSSKSRHDYCSVLIIYV